MEEGDENQGFSKGVYFIGKVLWGKGYTELIDMVSRHSKKAGNLSVDVFGSGQDLPEVISQPSSVRTSIPLPGVCIAMFCLHSLFPVY